jgi:hypothetical protein
MVKARIAATIGVPTGFLEPPQVLHYEVGEQFAPHSDYLDPDRARTGCRLRRRGQRIVTFLIYLNSDFEGGETDFPLLALGHKGGTGDALYFGNVDPSRRRRTPGPCMPACRRPAARSGSSRNGSESGRRLSLVPKTRRGPALRRAAAVASFAVDRRGE